MVVDLKSFGSTQCARISAIQCEEEFRGEVETRQTKTRAAQRVDNS